MQNHLLKSLNQNQITKVHKLKLIANKDNHQILVLKLNTLQYKKSNDLKSFFLIPYKYLAVKNQLPVMRKENLMILKVFQNRINLN